MLTHLHLILSLRMNEAIVLLPVCLHGVDRDSSTLLEGWIGGWRRKLTTRLHMLFNWSKGLCLHCLVNRFLSYLLFCWTCITVYQYSETNVMHFLFSLFRIKGLCMFRALLAHLQEVRHKRHLVYCVHVMSVGCTRVGVELTCSSSVGTAQMALGILRVCYVSWLHQGWSGTDITCTQYTKCHLCSTSWG
jgi:hypothetical protein